MFVILSSVLLTFLAISLILAVQYIMHLRASPNHMSAREGINPLNAELNPI